MIELGLIAFLREISDVTSALNSEDQTGGREDSTEGMIGAGSTPGSVRRGYGRSWCQRGELIGIKSLPACASSHFSGPLLP